ncbi:MAG: hypothetical protein KDA92_09980, partial [Planctomycetales bacterium]|nr:hypothetical protein [Planctomycetales bacterium]
MDVTPAVAVNMSELSPTSTRPPNTATHANGIARSPLRDAAAQLIKEFIWRYVIRFTPEHTPICLYASRRSGSTLLMEMLGTNRGIMFSDQPFSLYTAHRANLNRLPIPAYSQFTNLDADEECAFQAYVTGLLSGEIRANIPWKLWSPEFHLRNSRLCLKITDAKCMISWIAQHFDVQTVVMTRHPVGQALSVANAGWFTTGKGLLRSPGYVEQWLSSDQTSTAWDVYHGGSELEQRVLDWVLENLPLLRHAAQHPDCLFIPYEYLVLAPDVTVQQLTKHLSLPDPEKMLKRCRRPSRSTAPLSTPEQQALIQRGDRTQLIGSWRNKVSPQQLAAVA